MKTILVVDDVRTDRELIGKLVSSLGYHAEYASNGKEAVERAQAVLPALILMDVLMPEQDGFAACRRIKKDPATKDIPVVFVTAKSSATDQVWGKRQGAEFYLTKPFDATELTEVIRRYAA